MEAIRRTSQTAAVNYPHANNETAPFISSLQSRASSHYAALPAPHGPLKETCLETAERKLIA